MHDEYPNFHLDRSTQNTNLTARSSDRGYSSSPTDILTDGQSFRSSLGTMNLVREENITLNASAHFYLSQQGGAWPVLNDPPQRGLQCSIVNQTIPTQIPVSDANADDDLRCR